MYGYRRARISLVAATATVTALLCTGTAAAAAPSATDSGAAPTSTASQALTAAQAPVERLIVGYKSTTTEATSDAAAAKDAQAKGTKAGKRLGLERRLGTGAVLVDLGGKLGTQDSDAVMTAFRADPDVAYVVPDRRMYATAATPNDSQYYRQWDLFEATAGMNVPSAWDKATGTGVNVAVIDTGYVAHSDLSANVIAGYDFISDPWMANDGGGRDSNASDPGDWLSAGDCGTDSYGNPVPAYASNNSWHGTHVAGTIAASTNNSKGIAGIAYNATIQPVRVLGKCGGTTADIMDGITWASGGYVPGAPSNPNPADVVNMSLGGYGACDSGTQSAINGAVNRGATIVVAAGNDNSNASNYNPGNCANVINVAASDREGNRASYSNYGTIVDITAPGGETGASSANGIWSTLNTGTRSVGSETYTAYQGTSMAAPHIAGLAALMKQANPSMTPGQIETSIKNNARPLPGSCSGGCGAGLADAAATLGMGSGGTTFTNSANYNISDNATVESPITVTGITGYAPTDLKVAVDIKHTYRGDLKIESVAPNGLSMVLKNTSTSDSADNVITTYTVDASNVLASGTWKLRVTDLYTGDTGYIDSWSLTF